MNESQLHVTSFNSIDSVEVEGETITDPAVIKENIQKSIKTYTRNLKIRDLTLTSMRLQELAMRNKNGCKGNLKRRKFLMVSSSVQVTKHLAQMDGLCVFTSLSRRS
ncbi:hypothetical protein H5410_059154 [Solanum commersonii]|uniref:Uncharacterized protein n=1 Tax=Solanum commersonii TaxID=4109 RepID=A0A9J5W245_SOLCO|nr:hypothetical protein H5410_059154 [Solanum commersonii]